MSLYVDPSLGDPTQDLLTISWHDGALGQGGTSMINTSIGMISVTQVTYPGATTGQPTATRLSTLATKTSADGDHWNYPIVITAMNGGTNPYTGMSIVGNGATFVDTVTQVIHVVYDIGQCEGAGIQVFGPGSHAITAPNPVVLYHELSHAYHFAINQFPFPQDVCSGASFAGSDEPAAELDENVMRMELGLCQRDPCNHERNCGSGDTCSGSSYAPSGSSSSGASTIPSGVSHPSGVPSGPASMPSGPASMPPSGPPPDMPSGPASNLPGSFPNPGHASGSTPQGCFIVSAATGSAQSAEVAMLQQLRKSVASTSGVCGQLIEGILREYYQFSPQIAAELEKDSLVRWGVLTMVVRPLVAWFTLARVVGFEWDDRTAVSVAAQDVLTACPRRLAPRIVPILEAIRAGQPLPSGTPPQLLAFAPQIKEAALLPHVSWALLDSLLRAWTVTTRHLDVIGEVSQWLGNAPIDTFAQLTPPELLDQELATLAGFLGFRPAARLRMGSRLAEALPDSADALKRYGFIE